METEYFSLYYSDEWVSLWNTDGSFIGEGRTEDLFGHHYPWMSASCKLEDGTILVGMSLERNDESANEFVVYLVSGF